jgi:hypothetical protein
MKKCICIKDWNDYKIGETANYTIGTTTWFIGGQKISSYEFKEHFKAI